MNIFFTVSRCKRAEYVGDTRVSFTSSPISFDRVENGEKRSFERGPDTGNRRRRERARRFSPRTTDVSISYTGYRRGGVPEDTGEISLARPHFPSIFLLIFYTTYDLYIYKKQKKCVNNNSGWKSGPDERYKSGPGPSYKKRQHCDPLCSDMDNNTEGLTKKLKTQQQNRL